MSINIKPGDTFELSCPEGKLPTERAGELYPVEAKDKFYVIVSTEGSKVHIGPLRGGDFEVAIHCGADSVVKESISVIPIPQDKLPEKQPAFGPIAFGYPIWLWILLALVLSLLIGLITWIVRKIRQRPMAAPARIASRIINGQEQLENFLRMYDSGKAIQRNSPQDTVELYSKGNDCLRAFLEYKFQFKASWATTSEFLGTLKTSLVGFKGSQELVHQTESALSQADLVRFSKAQPNDESKKNFVILLKNIHRSIVAATTRDQGVIMGAKE